MQLKINKIHHMNNQEGLALLPEKSANLIIADPPYFEVKGDFDFVYNSFDEYLNFMEEQARLYKRILADNGTLFVYGHAKKIAYVQVIFDKYFNLENNITVHIFDRQTNKGIELFRCFAPVTERLLMYSNEIKKTGLQEIHDSKDCFRDIKEYMRTERDKLMFAKGLTTISQFNDFINSWTNTASVVSRHYFADSQYSFPTKEIYQRMQETGFWRKEYETLRQEYETLRQEYETLRRPFDNQFKLTDVMRFSQEGHKTKDYDHDTVKPEKLSLSLIMTCSKPGDLVVIPFAGSGTECAMAAKENRQFIGFDVSSKYVEMANKRVQNATAQLSLFDGV